ncbi:MAG TPA: phage tail tape measure protein [Polyangiaceae bacterium]|jgi:hypothetical protein
MSALREILAHFSIELDDKSLKEGEKGVSHFIETLKEAGKTVAEAFAVREIYEFAASQVEAGAQLKIMSERLGTTTDELQALQFAAGQAGVSADAMNTGLRFLNRNISEARTGTGDAAKVFHDLGIALKNGDGSTRSSTELIGDLADAVAKVPDAARQTEVAMKLLGRGGAELIPLLRQGGDAFRDARKQVGELGGGLTKEFTEKAHEAEAEQKKFTFALGGLKSEIATELLPVFVRVAETAARMVVNLRDIAKNTDLVKIAFGGALAGAALLAPELTALVVAGTALYLGFEDFYVMMRGGESVLGDALGPSKQQVVEDMRSTIENLKIAWDGTVAVIGEVGGAFWGLDQAASESGVGTITTVKQLADAVLELSQQLRAAVDNVRALLSAGESIEHGKFGEALQTLGQTTVGHELTGGPSKASKWGLRQTFNRIAGLPAEETPEAQANTADADTRHVRHDRSTAVPPPEAHNVDVDHWHVRHDKMITVQPHVMMLRDHVGPRGGSTFQQTNNTHVEVHTSSDKPKAVGDAVGQGVTDAQTRAGAKASTMGNVP